jgi:hypothetical protein
MSTKHVRTAADLARFNCGLKVECSGCGNSRTMDGFEAAAALGIGPLAAASARLKCSRCKLREARLTILPPPAPR